MNRDDEVKRMRKHTKLQEEKKLRSRHWNQIVLYKLANIGKESLKEDWIVNCVKSSSGRSCKRRLGISLLHWF